MAEIDKVLFNKAVEEFKLHFEDSENSRIIFSAPYGTGKSTFLKEVFDEVNQKEIFTKKKYNAFHLYPVNYSVATNEDIFKYLKYDLMYLLIEKGVQFEKDDFSYLTQLKGFTKDNAHTILATLLLFIPKIGGDLLKVYERFDKLKEEFLKECDDAEKASDEGANMFEYLTKIHNTDGSLYELDIYTKLINKVLERVKIEGNGDVLENVLIIDDLDRIDPAHVFRLFNVFAAHFDKGHDANKFGFDKVVFVCDIENIRNIFINQYGKEVDFNGYMDKFFSKTIFHFANYHSLDGWLRKSLTNNYKILANDSRGSTSFHPIDIDFVSDILLPFIKTNKVNFRNLQKLKLGELSENYEREYKSLIRDNRFFNLHFTRIAIVLVNIYGDTTSLLHRLNEMITFYDTLTIKQFGNNFAKIDRYYKQYLFPIITYNSHNFNEEPFDYYDENLRSNLSMKLTSSDNVYSWIVYEGTYTSAHPKFWKDLKKSIEILEQHGAI